MNNTLFNTNANDRINITQKLGALAEATGKADVKSLSAINIIDSRTNREKFLRHEFKDYPDETINMIIATSPIEAGISQDVIDRKAKGIIRFTCTAASCISFACGVPGGAVGFASGFAVDTLNNWLWLRVVTIQLMYLYGFKEFNELDDKAEAFILAKISILGSGAQIIDYFGNEAGKKAILNAAKELSKPTAKSIKETIAKEIKHFFKREVTVECAKLTSKQTAELITKAVPVVGGAVSAGITAASFPLTAQSIHKSIKGAALRRNAAAE